MTIDAIVAGAGIWGCTVARRHDGLGRWHPQSTHGRRAARNPAPAAGSRLLWADTRYLHEKADIQIARMCVEYRNQGVRPVDFDGIADGCDCVSWQG